jgi:hypothetical protein
MESIGKHWKRENQVDISFLEAELESSKKKTTNYIKCKKNIG